jgi:imidazolonepropionase-like amidohydrolase
MKVLFNLCLFLFLWSAIHLIQAQVSFPVNGIREPDQTCFLLRQATVHPEPGTLLEMTDLIIRNGKIEAIGKDLNPPKDAVIKDYKNMHIYPSLIDLYSDYGMPEPKKGNTTNTMVSSKEGAFSWNEAMRPEIKASELFTVKTEQAQKLRELGFGMVNTHYPDGISRGSSSLVFLGSENEHEMILKSEVAHQLTLNKGLSSQDYPGSLMGCLALLRQTYLDAACYDRIIKPKEVNLSLEAWIRNGSLLQIFAANDKFDILRIDKLAKEFNQNFIIKSNGDEYQRIEEVKKTNAKLIVPLRFPPLFEVEDPFDAEQIDLADLKHWELAPYNASILEKNNVEFSFTTNGLKDHKEFLPNLRKAVKLGLSKNKALAALTIIPAKWMGMEKVIGSLAAGKWANLLISNGDLFEEKTQIYENWVKGQSYLVKRFEPENYSGNYKIQLGSKTYDLLLVKKEDKYDCNILSRDSTKLSLQVRIEGRYLNGKFVDENKQVYLFSATEQLGIFNGHIIGSDGVVQNLQMKLNEDLGKEFKLESKENATSLTDTFSAVTFPFMAYGWTEKPKQKKYLIKNATLWTCEKDGNLSNTDLLIENGKIKKVAKNISDATAIIIDGTGKHVTPGIIDEHSHIAISRGVNECTEASTAEVRIGDVINPDDINIFRQLSGGVTTSQLLHGSCNPIGGQSAIIKLRWGASPEEMKFEGADPFIKFALGENVKRSGGNNNQRFPDSRMGVEQVYIDYFTRAKAYSEEIEKLGADHVRRNLDLEALAEILNKKRFITCHSYVQSEINMLMHVAEKFDFKVNTFTHILEGYKVADKMKKHGVGAASFSDWWAYKFEVYEAIPYNGAILHSQGVTTAFNSDDAEMARRLNQESAKAIKYGNLTETEALKFVTLNPAKLLHLDHRVGSLKEGKDADVVVWNGSPMSVYSLVEKTFVDGIKYYDKEEQANKQESIQKKERASFRKCCNRSPLVQFQLHSGLQSRNYTTAIRLKEKKLIFPMV